MASREISTTTHDNHYVWLEDGLGIRIYASGRNTYVVHYQESKQMRIKTLAQVGAISLEQAKDLALSFRRRITGSLTCDDAFKIWLARYARLNTKTYKQQEKRWAKYISPLWGKSQLITITAMDVAGLLALHVEHRTLGNRLVELFSSVWSRCIKWGLITTPNPCKLIDKPRLHSRTRYASETEIRSVLTAINNLTDYRSKAALQLLLLTGCRKSEILGLKWSDVNLDGRHLILRNTKNGSDCVVPLTDNAYQIIDALPRKHKVWLFPSDSSSGHLSDLIRAWQNVRDVTGLQDLRIHDLRRTVGSLLAQDGVSLPIIGAVLNHQSQKSTQIYARLDTTTKRAALEQFGKKLA